MAHTSTYCTRGPKARHVVLHAHRKAHFTKRAVLILAPLCAHRPQKQGQTRLRSMPRCAGVSPASAGLLPNVRRPETLLQAGSLWDSPALPLPGRHIHR